MTIQVLPPRLANQIAAGEVVERPSSVVKELVENSIDAGASRIDIEIEKGGAKLIRIRDNGCGVEKDQLGLALSRHATSKLTSLDDLEAIDSLGFRGEALASISSVSRLTFTSRTRQQAEAWQAYAEGRDMQVQVKPAAHPIGTTVEVIDLFFNTPARRKFLRTDKTEFNHIDELVRRIALSRFDLQLTLKHNGKVIRSYRPANTIEQQERRVASVTSTTFMQHCIALNCEHSDIKLWGWVGLPNARAPLDVQYSYVNGRMMRDKLINHALRQAYEEATGISAPPAYVLFIEVSVREVDVNVHPAKHEVRFHQARLVHDFIFQAVFKALSQGMQQDGALPAAEPLSYPGQHSSAAVAANAAQTSSRPQHKQHSYGIGGNAQDVDKALPQHIAENQSISEPPTSEHQGIAERQYSLEQHDLDQRSASGASASRSSVAYGRGYQPEGPSRQAIAQYQELLRTPSEQSTHSQAAQSTKLKNTAPAVAKVKLLSLVADKYLLLQDEQQLLLLDLLTCWQINCKLQLLAAWEQGVLSQPLLLPIAIKLDKNFVETAQTQQKLLNRLGLELNYSNVDTIIVRKVPAQLRQANLTAVLPELLQQLMHLSGSVTTAEVAPLCHWLALQGSQGLSHFTWEQATQIYSQFTEHAGDVQQQYRPTLFAQLDYRSVIERFNCDSTAAD